MGGGVIARRLMARTLFGLVSFLLALTFLAPAALGTVGRIREFHVPTAFSEPAGICPGPDGNLWFTDLVLPHYISRISTAGTFLGRSGIPTPNSLPAGIATSPGGTVWFSELYGNAIVAVRP